MNINLNGIPFECSNVIYISTNGNDNNIGTYTNPVKTYNQAFKLATDGSVIYFKPGVYDYLINVTEDNAYDGYGIIYDGNENVVKNITVYGGKNVFIKINNPESSYRDIHFLSFLNDNSTFIGCNIEYNVTNRSDNYSRSLFYYSKGNIYNTVFNIKSITSFMYCNNNSNTLTINNSQFIIEAGIESGWSGNPVIFKNCLFSGISTYQSLMTGDDNIFDFKYNKNNFPSKHPTCGLYTGKFKFSNYNYSYLINNILFIIDNENKFLSKGNNLSPEVFVLSKPDTLTDIYNNKDFTNTIDELSYNIIKRSV